MRICGLMMHLKQTWCAVAAWVALVSIASVLMMSAAVAEDRLTIKTASGPIEFTVELAETRAQQSRGLMFRNSLPERHGMLFDFGPPREVSMWMKNTLIPLDMIFVNADGTIHRIAAMTEPLSEAIVASQGDVKAVFEIIGGSAERLGIAAGDTIVHPIFANNQ